MWPNLLTSRPKCPSTNTLSSDDDINSPLMMIGRHSYKTKLKPRGLEIHCEVTSLVQTSPGTNHLLFMDGGGGLISSAVCSSD